MSIEAYLSPYENEQLIFKQENMNKKGFCDGVRSVQSSLEIRRNDWLWKAGYFGNSLEVGSIIADKDGNPMQNIEFEYEGNKYKTDDAGAISEVEPIGDASAGSGDELAKAQAKEL